MSGQLKSRRGFTLIELMIAVIIAAIVGASLLKMTMAQARFMEQQEAGRSARGVARGGVNRLVSDLRAVDPVGGIVAGSVAAGGQDFSIRVPYAFGVICVSAGATATAALLPVDSMMYASPGHTGFAIQNSTGAYNYYTSTVVNLIPTVAAANACLNALPAVQGSINPGTGFFPSVNGSPQGKVVSLIATAALNPIPPVGSIMFLYRTIRYEFKNSAAINGRIGLFRTMVSGGTTEEIATPFDNTARVNFYVLNNGVAQAAVPAPLSNIRGFELVLNGQSEKTPRGSAAPKAANVTTSVFFENRPD
jgi:prepilin-type N-terminal cleavage/methylation domain-containing protein